MYQHHLHHLHHLLGLLLLLLVPLYECDQRCLLEGGGSTDTFFVREDSQPGEEVGRLRVAGEGRQEREENIVFINITGCF